MSQKLKLEVVIPNFAEGACGFVDVVRLNGAGFESVLAVRKRPRDKAIKGDSLSDAETYAEAVKQLQNEREFLKSLKRHPNIVSYIDAKYNVADLRNCVLLEFGSGGSLLSFLENYERIDDGHLSEVGGLSICVDLLKGVHFLASNGVLHRDIRLANLIAFVAPSGDITVKIGDFDRAITVECRKDFTKFNRNDLHLYRVPVRFSVQPYFVAPEMDPPEGERHSYWWATDAFMAGLTLVDIIHYCGFRADSKDALFNGLLHVKNLSMLLMQDDPVERMAWFTGIPGLLMQLEKFLSNYALPRHGELAPWNARKEELQRNIMRIEYDDIMCETRSAAWQQWKIKNNTDKSQHTFRKYVNKHFLNRDSVYFPLSSLVRKSRWIGNALQSAQLSPAHQLLLERLKLKPFLIKRNPHRTYKRNTDNKENVNVDVDVDEPNPEVVRSSDLHPASAILLSSSSDSAQAVPMKTLEDKIGDLTAAMMQMQIQLEELVRNNKQKSAMEQVTSKLAKK